jgi:hypothetical protein
MGQRWKLGTLVCLRITVRGPRDASSGFKILRLILLGDGRNKGGHLASSPQAVHPFRSRHLVYESAILGRQPPMTLPDDAIAVQCAFPDWAVFRPSLRVLKHALGKSPCDAPVVAQNGKVVSAVADIRIHYRPIGRSDFQEPLRKTSMCRRCASW